MMNERIDELLWQAGGYTKIHNPNDSFLDGRYAITQEQLDKFAELIVMECASIVEAQKESLCEDDSEWNDYEFGYHDAVIDANNMIKQHFGVE